MAEIQVLGASHYPLLATPDEQMAILLRMMLRNPNLTEAQKDPANWPEEMQREWGDDEGVAAAAKHRQQMVEWNAKVRTALDDFNPDIVLIWGDDQYENFQEDVVPAFCVHAHDTFRIEPPKGNIWDETEAKDQPGARKAAKFLASGLLNNGFDAAYAYRPLHHPLGHAFTNLLFFLDYDRKGFPYPILPVSINCYGRHVICQKGGLPDFKNPPSDDDLDPPGPPPSRMFDLGAETARILADSPWRVSLIASSSWSHAFLNAQTAYLMPDRAADEFLYEALRDGDYAAWRNYPTEAIERCGQQEVLNWMCAVGALDALGRKPADLGFVGTWAFNSNKAFLVA